MKTRNVGKDNFSVSVLCLFLAVSWVDLHCVIEAFPHFIRIYHSYEGRIEKSVLRIAIWHHEACRVMTNGDPEVVDFSILLSHE